MKDIKNIILYTLKEIWANKIFLILFSVYNVILIGIALFAVYAFRNAPIEAKSFEGMLQMQIQIAGSVASIFILISIFSTSSLVVSFFSKGLIDLYLSKPISRQMFMYGRFLAITLFAFLNFLYMTLFIWVLTSSMMGVWSLNILWLPVMYTFGFVTLLAIIFLCGILTKSSVLGIILSYLVLMFQPVIAGLHNSEAALSNSPTIKGIINTLYYILPKSNELLSVIPKKLVMLGYIDSYEPVFTSFAFAALVFGASIFIFNKKDF